MGEVGEQAVRLENLDVVEAGVKGVKIVTGLKPGSNGDDGCYKQVGLSVNSRVIAVLNTLVSVTKIPHNHHHHDQPVIVADPFDLVVVHVQPFEALWDEGKVEPLRAIVDQMLIGQPQIINENKLENFENLEVVGGDVEPPQVVEGGHEPVQVDQLVVVQPGERS